MINQRWAVFDIDGTLLPGESMEAIFIRSLIREGVLSWAAVLKFLGKGAHFLLRLKIEHALKQNKYYLRGLDSREVQEIAAQIFQQEIRKQFADKGEEIIEELRSQGYRILLLSGAPDFLAEQLQRAYQADHVIATRLETENHRYTGRIDGLHPYGLRKTLLMKQTIRQLGIDPQQSLVFANHYSDADHMQLFGTAYAVNPDRKLKQIARQEGWEVVTLKH